MNSFLKNLLVTMSTTTIVAVVLFSIYQVCESYDHASRHQANKVLLSMISNSKKIPEKLKIAFFEVFNAEYECTYEGQNFNQIVIESFIEAINTTSQPIQSEKQSAKDFLMGKDSQECSISE